MDFSQLGTPVAKIKSGVWSGSGLFDLGFMTGATAAGAATSTPQMLLSQGGNLGLGTVTPSQRLEVNGSILASSSATNYLYMGQNGANINIVTSGTGQRLDFGTGFSPVLSVATSQNVGIGTTAPTSKLTVSDNTSGVFAAAIVQNNTSASGLAIVASPGPGYSGLNVNTSGNAGSIALIAQNGITQGSYTTSGWTHTSDARLKTNVETYENSLEKLKQLRGVTYNWKNNPEGRKELGFIAQEVKDIVPEVVIGSEEEGYSMVYQNMVALVVNALKEISDKLDKMSEVIVTKLIQTDKLCIGTTCVDESALQNMMNQGGVVAPAPSTPVTNTVPETSTTTDTSWSASSTEEVIVPEAAPEEVVVPEAPAENTETPAITE
jgi:hypothetical protein